jgi:hypothetical protein
MRGRFLMTGVAVAIAGWLAPPAGAATTTIGQIAPVGATFSGQCCSFIQTHTDSARLGYTVPAAPAGESWTIASWSTRGGAAQGFAKLLVWRPTSVGGEFRLVGAGANTVVDPAQAPAIPTSIAVQPGDEIGIRTDTHHDVQGAYLRGGGDEVGVLQGEPATGPAVGETAGALASTYGVSYYSSTTVNASATLTSAGPTTSAPAASTAQQAPVSKKCKRKHGRKRCKKRKH